MGVPPLAGARVRRAALALAALAVLAGAAAPAGGQGTAVLIVTGLAGEPRFDSTFHAAAATLYDIARDRWGVAESSLIYLAEQPATDTARIRGAATREAVARAMLALSRRVAPGDILLLFLLAHGSGSGPTSRVSLPGPDATAADFAGWLSGFAQQTVVVVNAGSASGDFVDALAGPKRLVVTATRTAMERNETLFAGHYVRGLAGSAADADKDGRTSVREAFEYARREVAREYEADHRLQTEHARLSDSLLAATIAFGAPVTHADPRVAALLAERRALESQVAELRGRKTTMDAAAYDRELERLLLAIAEKTQAIRAAGGRAP
jgi:hypothetical protein